MRPGARPAHGRGSTLLDCGRRRPPSPADVLVKGVTSPPEREGARPRRTISSRAARPASVARPPHVVFDSGGRARKQHEKLACSIVILPFYNVTISLSELISIIIALCKIAIVRGEKHSNAYVVQFPLSSSRSYLAELQLAGSPRSCWSVSGVPCSFMWSAGSASNRVLR